MSEVGEGPSHRYKTFMYETRSKQKRAILWHLLEGGTEIRSRTRWLNEHRKPSRRGPHEHISSTAGYCEGIFKRAVPTASSTPPQTCTVIPTCRKKKRPEGNNTLARVSHPSIGSGDARHLEQQCVRHDGESVCHQQDPKLPPPLVQDQPRYRRDKHHNQWHQRRYVPRQNGRHLVVLQADARKNAAGNGGAAGCGASLTSEGHGCRETTSGNTGRTRVGL